MARPIRNDIDYFPHPVNHGKKMFFIRSRFKCEGYAVWFMLLEELGKANYHYLDLKNEVDLMYLSASFMVPESLILEIIEALVKLGEFCPELWGERILWNEKFIESISDAYKKRSNNCITKAQLIEELTAKGRIKPGKLTPKPSFGSLKGPVNPQRKEEERKEEERKGFLPINPEDSERAKTATAKISEFFGISELRQTKAFIAIGNFVRHQESKGQLDFLADQFTAYKVVKSKDPKFKHNWQNYIGDPQESYQNGAWVSKDWTKHPDFLQAETGQKDSRNMAELKRRTMEKAQEME